MTTAEKETAIAQDPLTIAYSLTLHQSVLQADPHYSKITESTR